MFTRLVARIPCGFLWTGEKWSTHFEEPWAYVERHTFSHKQKCFFAGWASKWLDGSCRQLSWGPWIITTLVDAHGWCEMRSTAQTEPIQHWGSSRFPKASRIDTSHCWKRRWHSDLHTNTGVDTTTTLLPTALQNTPLTLTSTVQHRTLIACPCLSEPFFLPYHSTSPHTTAQPLALSKRRTISQHSTGITSHFHESRHLFWLHSHNTQLSHLMMCIKMLSFTMLHKYYHTKILACDLMQVLVSASWRADNLKR